MKNGLAGLLTKARYTNSAGHSNVSSVRPASPGWWRIQRRSMSRTRPAERCATTQATRNGRSQRCARVRSPPSTGFCSASSMSCTDALKSE
jgi:hypothetical protein